jgi:hypothetical protein
MLMPNFMYQGINGSFVVTIDQTGHFVATIIFYVLEKGINLCFQRFYRTKFQGSTLQGTCIDSFHRIVRHPRWYY